MSEMQQNWQLNDRDLRLIDIALREDLGETYCDLTSQTMFGKKNISTGEAKIISKEDRRVVVCGLALLPHIFKKFGQRFQMGNIKKDGDTLEPGETLVNFQDQMDHLLMGERTALNFLSHLSGISTLTAQFVNQIKGFPTKILDTRKTTPGFRHLEKYAVFCGGGVNHREGLYDAILIKNNHIDFLGGMENSLAKLTEDLKEKHSVIVEVRTLEELEIVCSLGKNKVSRILFDNMAPPLLQKCVKIAKEYFQTEASGGINLESIRTIAECGVNFTSIGYLTHSAPHIDFAMRVIKS